MAQGGDFTNHDGTGGEVRPVCPFVTDWLAGWLCGDAAIILTARTHTRGTTQHNDTVDLRLQVCGRVLPLHAHGAGPPLHGQRRAQHQRCVRACMHACACMCLCAYTYIPTYICTLIYVYIYTSDLGLILPLLPNHGSPE